MEDIAAPLFSSDDREPALGVLIADHEPLARALLASRARETVGEISILEAEDGAEAIQLGLQRRPEIAILDVDMPRLGGIEAALTLRVLRPSMRLALRTADQPAHRERAHEERLPLFGHRELERTLAWLRAQVAWLVEMRPEEEVPHRRTLFCGACGYGIVRATPPVRCPMCQADRAWIDAPSPSQTVTLTG